MNTARSHLSHAWLSLYVIHTHADMRRCVYVPVAPFIFRPEAGYWVSLNVPVPLFLFPFFLFLSNHSSTSLSLTHTHIHTHTHTHTHTQSPGQGGGGGGVGVVSCLCCDVRRFCSLVERPLCVRPSLPFPSFHCRQLFSPSNPQLTIRRAEPLLSSFFILLHEKKRKKKLNEWERKKSDNCRFRFQQLHLSFSRL